MRNKILLLLNIVLFTSLLDISTNAMTLEEASDSAYSLRYTTKIKNQEYWFYDYLELRYLIDNWESIDVYNYSDDVKGDIESAMNGLNLRDIRDSTGAINRNGYGDMVSLLKEPLTYNQRKHLTNASLQLIELDSMYDEYMNLFNRINELKRDLLYDGIHVERVYIFSKIETEPNYYYGTYSIGNIGDCAIHSNSGFEYESGKYYFIVVDSDEDGYVYKDLFIHRTEDKSWDRNNVNVSKFLDVASAFELAEQRYENAKKTFEDCFDKAINNSSEDCIPIKKYENNNGLG